MRRLSPIHGLTLFFLIGLFFLAIFFRGQIPRWHSLLFLYTVSLGILFVLKVSADRKEVGRATTFLNQFSPILFIVLIYQSLGELIQHLRPDVDRVLIHIDYALFGVHPTLWMERFIVPWFTDVMSFAYVSYYFLPVILVLTLYLERRTQSLDESIFVLTFGYYLSFIGYILFPAIGPRFVMADLYTVPLEGSFLTDWVRDGLNAIEHNKRDCMPSGHTQIALMVLSLAHRHERRLFYIFLPLVCGLILSTVYLRYHYVVDLFVGIAFTAGSLLFAPRLFKWWNAKLTPR